jgi:hypothetical protein
LNKDKREHDVALLITGWAFTAGQRGKGGLFWAWQRAEFFLSNLSSAHLFFSSFLFIFLFWTEHGERGQLW